MPLTMGQCVDQYAADQERCKPEPAPEPAYDSHQLYDADPNCKHEIVALWSGVKCKHCSGWFCY
jgi:hypothetical protein